MITRKNVQYVAKLARLGITKKEEKKFTRELSSVLDYIEKLKEVDISKIEPTSYSIAEPSPSEEGARREKRMKFSLTKVENVMRSDESQKPKAKSQKLIVLAPETKEGYLKVKKNNLNRYVLFQRSL